MKIISVIVDEKPNKCNNCEFQGSDNLNHAVCVINGSEIFESSYRLDDCPLRVMPSDEEIKEAADTYRNNKECTGYSTYPSGVFEHHLDGINYLKSKLT